MLNLKYFFKRTNPILKTLNFNVLKNGGEKNIFLAIFFDFFQFQDVYSS